MATPNEECHTLTGHAGEVSTRMREAGSAVLGDPDLSYSHEEMAEAIYIAMETARLSSSDDDSILCHPFQISERFERAVDTVSKSAPIHRVSHRGTASLNRIKALIDFIWTTAPYQHSLPEPLRQRARELAECPDRWVAGSFQGL